MRMKVYDLGVSIVEITSCTMPICITRWYTVGMYSPELIKHKNIHLVLEYDDVPIYVCTHIMRVEPWFRTTITLMWTVTQLPGIWHSQVYNPLHIFFVIHVLWKKVPVGVVYLTVSCDYPYLVSLLIAVLLPLHLVTLMFFIVDSIA